MHYCNMDICAVCPVLTYIVQFRNVPVTYDSVSIVHATVCFVHAKIVGVRVDFKFHL